MATTVEAIMDNAQEFVNTLVDDLNLTIGNEQRARDAEVAGAKAELRQALLATTFTSAKPPGVDTGEAPEVPRQIDLELPEPPGEGPVYQDITDFNATSVAGVTPENTAIVPVIKLPNQPSTLKEFVETVPTFVLPKFPTPPSELTDRTILPPELATRAALVAPDILLPQAPSEFTGVLPVAPTNLTGEFQRAYSDQRTSVVAEVNGYIDAQLAKLNPRYHTQMSAIESQLDIYLAGGTGLNPEIEDAIYYRAQAKNDLEAKRVQDSLMADTAARGFTLPSGAMFSGLVRARQDAANNNRKQASDIAIAQAEMEQKNLQFAVTTSAGMRTAMVNAMLSYMQNLSTINGQALEFAKSVLNSLIEVYNTAVKVYTLQIEKFKADVMNFDTQLKLVTADVELFLAKVKNEEALIGIDRAKIEIYRAQLDALNTLAAVFKSQVDSALAEASLEKLKLEVFQSKVQVYSAQVQSKNAEWQGHNAAIEGESAKAKLYAAQVEAFNAEIQAYKAKLDTNAETVRAQALVNKARADQYVAEVGSFNAQVSAESERVNAEIESQRQYWSAVNGKNQVAETVNRINLEGYKEDTNARLIAYKTEIEAELKKVDMTMQMITLSADIGKTFVGINGQTASAALAGINTLASRSLAE